MGFPLNSPPTPDIGPGALPSAPTMTKGALPSAPTMTKGALSSELNEKHPPARPAWREIYDSIIAGVSQYEGIDSSQARIDLRFLIRQNSRCALDISVLGPRRMKPHAIWSWIDGKIFYYDSGGKRWKDEDVDPSIQPPADLAALA